MELDCKKYQARTHRISHGRHGRLSPGTYREYGKEKEDPHRAGDEELPRINWCVSNPPPRIAMVFVLSLMTYTSWQDKTTKSFK